MKKLSLFAVSVLFCSNSFAWVVTSLGSQGNICKGKEETTGCLVLTPLTTSFPLSMLILDSGVQIDLNSAEASARLDLEAQGLAEKQLITVIAEDSKMSVQQITETIQSMKENRQEVSVAAVIMKIKK